MDPKFFRQYADILREFGADNGPIGVAGRQPVQPGITTNAQGQRIQQTPNLMGVQQTKNLDTGDTTTDYNQGPLSASQTKNAAGATTAQSQEYDFMWLKLEHNNNDQTMLLDN